MFKIAELHYAHPRPHVALDVQGIEALPAALQRLAEQDHDLEPSLKALQEAVETQRKRKALDAAINDLTIPAEKVEE